MDLSAVWLLILDLQLFAPWSTGYNMEVAPCVLPPEQHKQEGEHRDTQNEATQPFFGNTKVQSHDRTQWDHVNLLETVYGQAILMESLNGGYKLTIILPVW